MRKGGCVQSGAKNIEEMRSCMEEYRNEEMEEEP
jgi:hypothetical protein